MASSEKIDEHAAVRTSRRSLLRTCRTLVSRQVLEDEAVLDRLLREQPVARERGGQVGVDALSDLAAPRGPLLTLGVGLSHRRVDDDGTRELVAVERSGDDADEAAHAVADEHRRPPEGRVAV
jgi:hypothetical protein